MKSFGMTCFYWVSLLQIGCSTKAKSNEVKPDTA